MKAIRIAFAVMSMMRLAQGAGAPSQDALIKQVLSSIESKDQQGLEQLTISKEEFKKYVWPTLAARVDSSMTSDKYYAMYVQASGEGLKQHLSALGGKKWELVKVSPGAVQKQGKDYRLFLTPEVLVRDATGREQTVKPVGGLLEQGGTFKVTTFYLRDAGAAR